jgi:DNA-binding transcriptional MerR regulator
MERYFSLNKRLGIELPMLDKAIEDYDQETQHAVLFHWEKVRGAIPDRIAELEAEINTKQKKMNKEEDIHTSATINSEIAELASIINDLLIWYRFQSYHTSEPTKAVD